MTLTDASSSSFTELEPEELGDYRPLNKASLGSLLLGMASFLGLLHPALLLVPAFGVVLALVGLRQLQQEDLRQSGRALALAGLCLSLLFASWSVTRQLTRSGHLYTQGRLFGEAWLELVRQGDYFEAHQMTIHKERRIQRGDSLEKHYEPRPRPSMEDMKKKGNVDPTDPAESDRMLEMMSPSPRDELDSFFKHPMVQRVRDLGAAGQFTFLENVEVRKGMYGAEEILQLYQASGRENGKPSEFRFVMILERDAQTGPGNWRVKDLMKPEGR